MKLVDTHSHLYHKNLQSDLDAVIERCQKHFITAIVLPNINEESIEPMNKLVLQSSADLKFYASMGLHPCDVKEDVYTQLRFFEQELNSGAYVAVGETGLDYYWDVSLKTQQQIAFQTQIEWSIEKNIPIIIHSRNATADCIELVKNFGRKAKGVFHCFAGTLEEAKQIIDLGFYLGIGGTITYKNSIELNEILKQLGLENIVLETDSPYLPPVPHRGKRNESSYLHLIAEHIATLKNVSAEDVATITTANAEKLFAINA
jgi:TatD DNase family protein